jgi:predicted O-linked N-acetylglucosamine transferase (SPINDLY family)
VFARRPAPVRVTWLGYPDTTGLAEIDYRLTDACADPQGATERFHVEQLVRLEHGFLCYQPPPDAPAPAASARRGAVTFGSFNNAAKVSPAVLRLWAQVVASVPGSRLVLKAQAFAARGARDHIASAFAAAGGDAKALTLLEPAAAEAEHLGFYREIDIALDTYPYHGTTTTCEALWMGVPVVTLAGPTHVSRVGASLLSAAGLPELVARTPEEYVRKAAELARDANRLGTLRAGLRDRLRASALLDAAGFTRALEAAFETLARR